MKWFKSLQYLNLALNNISHFEDRSLSSCECLEKLDLTLNCIDVEGLPSLISNLSRIKTFRELFTCWEIHALALQMNRRLTEAMATRIIQEVVTAMKQEIQSMDGVNASNI
jgi:hypothetical protein